MGTVLTDPYRIRGPRPWGKDWNLALCNIITVVLRRMHNTPRRARTIERPIRELIMKYLSTVPLRFLTIFLACFIFSLRCFLGSADIMFSQQSRGPCRIVVCIIASLQISSLVSRGRIVKSYTFVFPLREPPI